MIDKPYKMRWCRPSNFKTKEEIIESFPKAVKDLVDSKCGCYHWDLGVIDDNYVSIALGWSIYDDEPEKEDNYYHDGYHIVIKIGMQPTNSGAWCDLDVDFYMPLLENGDIWDTEDYVWEDDNPKSIIEGLFHTWELMKEYYKEHKLTGEKRMTTYKVTIKTTHEATFTVDAETKDEAYELAKDEFENSYDLGDLVDSETIIEEEKD